jgi:predicted DCC family thiol-disulfide oxidoreductase YuxK
LYELHNYGIKIKKIQGFALFQSVYFTNKLSNFAVSILASNYIILFDGVCNFCNYWVNFILKHNDKKHLQFASLQSEYAQELLRQHGFDPSQLTSVVFIKDGKLYSQSSAVAKVCKELNWPWKIFYGIIIIPKFIRDFCYNFIAKRRYKWFGKKEVCMVPTAETKGRFLG